MSHSSTRKSLSFRLVGGLVVLTIAFSGLSSGRAESSVTESQTTPPATTQPVATQSGTTRPVVELKVADSEGLKANLGREVTVTGVVAKAALSASGKVFRIEFESAQESGFLAVIFPANFAAFREQLGEDLSAALTGKNVVISGKLVDYKGKPEIVLSAPSQLKVEK